ncbi:hypothetical protein ACFPZL_03460 [Leucobacter soli]|uniref:DUF1269 domain-containing protein n=1 Tax=Leucobacter soli TaxID=2812850 RepID=A0A916NG19_9MICO|nr:hypothetical protein [Leucobacter soli]CAG7601403.1 hypothetical protein LEUCIP111803_00458 [Leucobacter soli]
MATEQFAGPVDYLVFAFDEHADLGTGFKAVLDRVQEGVIEILDIELVSRDGSGAPVRRTFSELDGASGIDLSVFDGVESDILDEDDLAGITAELRPGQIAVAVVYEDRSLAVAADAWASAGGVELFSGGIDVNELGRKLEEGAQP